MADRPARNIFDSITDFERAFESLFDELLISRWRGNDSRTTVLDMGDHYQVRMAGIGGDPKKLDIEASDRRLIVRIAGDTVRGERIVTFRHPVDRTAVSARIIDGGLEVILAKQHGRKIAVG